MQKRQKPFMIGKNILLIIEMLNDLERYLTVIKSFTNLKKLKKLARKLKYFFAVF